MCFSCSRPGLIYIQYKECPSFLEKVAVLQGKPLLSNGIGVPSFIRKRVE